MPPKRSLKDVGSDSESSSEDEYFSEQQKASLEQNLKSQYRSLQETLHKERISVARADQEDALSIVTTRIVATNELQRKRTKYQSTNKTVEHYDSRVLADVSELAKVAAQNIKSGDSSKRAVTVDDFIKFCKRYMLVGVEVELMAQVDEDEGMDAATLKRVHQKVKQDYLQQFDQFDQFEQFNWYKMGALYNTLSNRCVVTDHLLGPLEVTKKVREMKERIRLNTTSEVTRADSSAVIEQEANKAPTTPAMVAKVFKTMRSKLGYNKINFYKMILHPTSFAQSVENMFYASFLFKDGRLEMKQVDGWPHVCCVRDAATTEEKQKRKELYMSHLIFQLQWGQWQKLVEELDIKESFL